MTPLIDDLTAAMEALLADGIEIPASDLRLYEAKVIAAIAALEARARGNRIHYTAGVPDDAMGMEGDMALNKANGDVYQFTGGTFSFLFNILPTRPASGSTKAITAQVLGTDPDTGEYLVLLSPDAPTAKAGYVLAEYVASAPPPPPPTPGGFPYKFSFSFPS